jgi:hypothetical protein
MLHHEAVRIEKGVTSYFPKKIQAPHKIVVNFSDVLIAHISLMMMML